MKQSLRVRMPDPVRPAPTMRGPRRKPSQGNGLGLARLLALFAALGAGGVTYVSVQTLGQLVLQQHKGAAAAGAGVALSGGTSWRDTWKLASELGAGGVLGCPSLRNALMLLGPANEWLQLKVAIPWDQLIASVAICPTTAFVGTCHGSSEVDQYRAGHATEPCGQSAVGVRSVDASRTQM